MFRPAAGVMALLIAGVSAATAQELARATMVDPVRCADDPAQTYALYLPSDYTPDRVWPVLMGFHAGGRGRAIVETYQAAAEQYGYIVAASNNSRNGPWDASIAAVKAMSGDVARRFPIDAERVYLTGLSGGARVALQVALGTTSIAGVIASAAGFPDSRPRQSVPFAIFATTGTEDFNYVEMRQLDRKLESPHRLAVFNGGHSLPPADVALEAIEWLELHGMRTKRRQRDEALLDRLFARRQSEVDEAGSALETLHQLEALVADFEGLRDVSSASARLAQLARQPEIKKAVSRERSDLDAEARMLTGIFELEAGLGDSEQRLQAITRLRDRLSRLARTAAAAGESPERNQARRVLRAVTAGANERVQDEQYRRLLAEFGSRGR